MSSLTNDDSDEFSQSLTGIGNGATAVPVFTVGSVAAVPYGTPPTVSITGTNANPVLNFQLETGASSSSLPSFQIGTVTSTPYPNNPSVTLTGTAANPVLNFVLESGQVGTSFTYQGTYSSSTTYRINDVVTYQNSSFIAIATTLNHVPTSTSYWSLMALAGTDGTNISFVGNYTSGVVYNIGQAVFYNGSSYIALLQNQNILPTNTTYWNLIASQGQQGIQGTAGTNGTNGANGGQGPKGDQGPQGPQGPAGDSTAATAAAVAAGVSAAAAAGAAVAAASSASSASTAATASATSATAAENAAQDAASFARHFIATDAPSRETCFGQFAVSDTFGDNVLYCDRTGTLTIASQFNILPIGTDASVFVVDATGDCSAHSLTTDTINYTTHAGGTTLDIGTNAIFGQFNTMNLGTVNDEIFMNGVVTVNNVLVAPYIDYPTHTGGSTINIGTNTDVDQTNVLNIGSSQDIIDLTCSQFNIEALTKLNRIEPLNLAVPVSINSSLTQIYGALVTNRIQPFDGTTGISIDYDHTTHGGNFIEIGVNETTTDKNFVTIGSRYDEVQVAGTLITSFGIQQLLGI